MRLVLVLALLVSPFPSWAQVGRVSVEAPTTPTPTVGGGVTLELSPSALSADAFKPGLGLSGVLPAASVDPEIRAVAGSDIAAGQPNTPVLKAVKPVGTVAQVVPAGKAAKPAANQNAAGLKVLKGG